METLVYDLTRLRPRKLMENENTMASTDADSGPATIVDVPTPPIGKAEREYQAFRRLLPQLMSAFAGKFVAIHDEQMVDSDTDDVALILRVQARG
jgi:hypothetical protein